MHDAAYVYVNRTVIEYDLDRGDILDLGGRNVNGTTRPLFPRAESYTVVDITPHPSVDIICDAGDLNLTERFDCVVTTELLEHTIRAADIIRTAYRHLRPGGWLVATMAGPGRPEHGQHGDLLPQPDEYYRNVEPDLLEAWLKEAGFDEWTIDVFGEDVRCVAQRSD